MTISAVTFIGAGSTQPGTGNPTIVLDQPGGSAPAGGLVFVTIAKENAGTTDGTTSEITTVVDDVGGNTWISAGRFRNSEGGVALGSYVDLWYSVLTNGLSIGSAIGVHKSTDLRCVATAHKATITAGAVRVLTPVITLANDSAAPGSMSTSGLTSVQHLHIRINAMGKATSEAITPSAGWTAITGGFLLGVGPGAGRLRLDGEHKISTSVGETSAPTTVAVGKVSSILIAISEIIVHAGVSVFAATGAMSSAATRIRTHIRTMLCVAAGNMSAVRKLTFSRTTAVLAAGSVASAASRRRARTALSAGIGSMFSGGSKTGHGVFPRTAAFAAVANMSSVAVGHTTFPRTAAFSGAATMFSFGAVSLIVAPITVVEAVGSMESSATLISRLPSTQFRSLIMLEGALKPTSNLATWSERLELFDSETGHGIDLVERVESVTVTLRDIYTSEIVLRGDIEDGSVFVINPGIIEWSFPPETMSGLDPKSYDVGCLVEMQQETIQVLLGHVAVRKGL